MPRGRALGWREATALFLLPFLFTSLFLLSSAHLLADIGRAVGIGRWFGWYGEATFGRIVLLFLFNEIADRRRRLADRRPLDPQLALARAAPARAPFCASLTPQIASFGSGAAGRGAAPAPARRAACRWSRPPPWPGLWAQTFLLTGLMLDAIHGRRPAVDASVRHWREGAVKGAIYSFVFMALVQLAGLAADTRCSGRSSSAAPALTAVLAGTLLYPLGRTLIESFDGSAPVLSTACAPTPASGPAMRAASWSAAGSALAILLDLPLRDAWLRFLLGAVVGALAYAGVDLLRDLRAVRARRAPAPADLAALCPGRACSAASPAGAVAWYLDAAQLAVIAAKLAAYATVHAPAPDYIVYPLFSKWGP